MSSKTQVSQWGWKGLLLGLLAQAACGAVPEALEEAAREDAQEDSVPTLNAPPSPEPTWSTPTFATGTAVATDGHQSLVVWRDVLRPSEMFAARVSKNGRLLDPESIPLNPESAFEPGAPAVAFDGEQFIVTWHGPSTLAVARVNRDGTLDGPPIALVETPGSGSSRSGIACTWRKCLVAWAEYLVPQGVRGIMVEFEGTGIRSREILIASPTPANTSFGVPVAFSNNRFLVAWSSDALSLPKVFAARVTYDGTVLDPGGFLLSDTPGAQTFLDAVGTRQGFLVAWSDSRTGTLDIFGTFVRPDGFVPNREGFPISTGPDEDFTPALAYDGHRVLATWARQSPGQITLLGNFVSAGGTLDPEDSFLLSDGAFARELDQDVVSLNGKFFMAYGAAPIVDEPPFQVILGTHVKKDGTRVDDPAIRISHSPSVEETLPASQPLAR
ncbi:hypothetical protein SAMN05444354_1077 [Stigmatella aurantiaca]|uniref:Lipoprotein n=1 Tax=Stigmatella aurantiaca TaxID=41 RepID=A0A1H7RE50_STIAU|nr:hypothetical protein [Stigmatella aurantiaca]SEL58453.1 hypothetical protein SAMN05444354_1077 [Stigmatella aurantiaca]